ncbi:MAG: putative zinc-binding protein [Planctomycetaceae bacterium]|nr:putative zinc-binding protein [Planctomycetaceae bacterium]
MADHRQAKKTLVIPCSGVGKVHGLISREAVYHVTDKLLPGNADTACLALLVTGDDETKRKVQQTPCVTVDGCPKLCAFKNVELSGGKVAKGIRVYDVMKRHRGANFGTATALSDEGWTVVEELAAEAAQVARQAD